MSPGRLRVADMTSGIPLALGDHSPVNDHLDKVIILSPHLN